MHSDVYSAVEKGVLLHRVFSLKGEAVRERIEVTPAGEILQVACLTLGKGKTFRPHTHIRNVRTTEETQEMWIVLQGSVSVSYYDVDGSLLEVKPLSAGSVSVSFRGGHNYKILTDETRVLEVKNGPYCGQEKDKRFLDEGQDDDSAVHTAN